MFLNKLAEHDSFGFPIQLNYRRQGHYGTKLGGVCSITIFVVYWTMVTTLLFNIFFKPRFDTVNYVDYYSPNEMKPVVLDGTASLAVQLDNLNVGGTQQDLARYVRILFLK